MFFCYLVGIVNRKILIVLFFVVRFLVGLVLGFCWRNGYENKEKKIK